MDLILNPARAAAEQTIVSLLHNLPFLLVGIVLAATLKLLMEPARIRAFLGRFRSVGVLAATGAAVATPLCSCGTTAVVLGMMASTMPWAPIVAFMVASPLSSPEGLILSAGVFGWPFSLACFFASIALGLAGGGVAALAESRGWLADQARLGARNVERSGAAAPACSCSQAAVRRPALDLRMIVREILANGRRLLPMFVGFAFIGYFLNGLIPAQWMSALFGSGRLYGVPLAATLGLPLYINSEGALPLVRASLDSGMSPGAALAFLIAGAGTSIGAIAGALTIARWKVVALVVGVLWAGSILSGYALDLLVGAGLA